MHISLASSRYREYLGEMHCAPAIVDARDRVLISVAFRQQLPISTKPAQGHAGRSVRGRAPVHSGFWQ